MTQHLFFDGQDLNDFGCLPCSANLYASATRTYESIEVPGRSGALLVDLGSYRNLVRRWDMVFRCADPLEAAGRLRTWLGYRAGYRRIEDTLHPEEFYIGYFLGGLDSTIRESPRFAAYTLEFNCKPQRWLKSGETVHRYSGSGVLVNPESTEALPLIRVWGNGSCTVNGRTITISDNAGNYTDVDCDLQEAFRGDVSRNARLTLEDGSFPVLAPGENQISKSGVSRIEITPRWWRL